jgi:hypothetical protein
MPGPLSDQHTPHAALIVFLFNLNTKRANILLRICPLIPALFVYIVLTIFPVFYPIYLLKTPLTLTSIGTLPSLLQTNYGASLT